jgi:hypothetical protein
MAPSAEEHEKLGSYAVIRSRNITSAKHVTRRIALWSAYLTNLLLLIIKVHYFILANSK